jgi:plastocyanin domain-containing protein
MKSTAVSIVITSIIIAGAIIYSKNIGNGNQPININNANTEVVNLDNVTIVDGQQIVSINVKGGYTPRKSFAKAGIPTVLRFNTNGTFDCSAFIRIPSLKVLQSLPQSGTTDIKVENPKEGILQGTCGMGMYQFTVEFK